MLTPEDKKFVTFWEQNRIKEQSLFQQLRFVIPIALILGVATLLNLFTGWYTRAIMVANAQFSPMVIIVGIVIVAVFTSIFYKRHRWEMNEQHYLELKAKINKAAKQQSEALNSPVINEN